MLTMSAGKEITKRETGEYSHASKKDKGCDPAPDRRRDWLVQSQRPTGTEQRIEATCSGLRGETKAQLTLCQRHILGLRMGAEAVWPPGPRLLCWTVCAVLMPGCVRYLRNGCCECYGGFRQYDDVSRAFALQHEPLDKSESRKRSIKIPGSCRLLSLN